MRFRTNITAKRTANRTAKRTAKRTNTLLSIPGRDQDITAIIDGNAIAHNLGYLRAITKTDIMAVLKADAYGYGLIETAKICRRSRVQYIGVGTLGEAILLRKSGDTGRILAWIYDIDGPELLDAFNLEIDVAICDELAIPKFIKCAIKSSSGSINVTMFIDTGINRNGISYENAVNAFIQVAACKKLTIVGMMSHLVCSEIPNSPIIFEQLRKFRELRDKLASINIRPQLVHIANTAGCLNYDMSDFTMCRSGAGVLGTVDLPYRKFFKLPLTVTSRVIQLKDIAKGKGIGYNWTYFTKKKMRVAIVPVGYADSVPRSASSKLHVYINGTKRKVLGLISMDQMTVEAHKGDSVNDVVFVFGNGNNCKQTVYDVAKAGGITPEEVTCNMGYRINRIYKM